MKKRYFILIGILSYLFFTIGNMPAAKIISLAKQNSNLAIKLYGVHGSIWNGSADKLILPDNTEIDNLQWSLNPASLLIAKLGGEVKATVKQQNIIGHISINAFGNFSASDVRARIDASVMQELIQMPLGELGGYFNINIESFEHNPQGLPIITASLNWKNAKLTIADTVDLGFLNLNIKPGDGNQLLIDVNNKKGQLGINGTASIDDKKAYELNIRLTPKKNSAQNIRQSLSMFSRRQNDGSYLVKRKGKLSDLGL